jgi:predicted TIM-barrel fold metal-dependent hydrolase
MLIVDAHVHLGKFRESRINGDADLLMQAAEKLGINKLCVSSYEGIAYDFRTGNQDVAEATKRFNGRIFGYVVVNPRFGEQAAEEVRKYVKVHDFRGIKLYYPSSGDPDVHRIFEEATKLDVPLKIHAEIEDISQLADRFPRATIILCHMGGTGDWVSGIRLAKLRDNIILDTTGTVTDSGMVEEAVDAVGPERVVYGSDMPLLNPVPQLAKVRTADIDEESKRLILGQNIARILKLEKK